MHLFSASQAFLKGSKEERNDFRAPKPILSQPTFQETWRGVAKAAEFNQHRFKIETSQLNESRRQI